MAGRFSVEAVFRAVDKVTAPVTRMQNRVGKMTRSIDGGLRRLNRSLGKFTSGLRSGVGAAMKFGAIGIGAVTASVTLLVREFSKIEDAEAAFTPLLGGVKRAKELVDELNKTAASTPFQFQTLAEQAGQLLPVMDGDIKNTIKTLRMLGDTAGGNAQKLDSITRGFTKAMLKGKVDLESLNMIGEAGVPIFGELASVMGTEVNEAFFKMISAGKITTRDLTKAFDKMTSKGGIFFGGMEIASRTTSGLFSTLKDNVALTAAEIGGVLAPTIKELLKGVTGVAQRVREWVKNNRELISERFIAFVNIAKDAVSSFVETIKNLNNEQSLLQRLGEVITFVSSAFSFLAEHGKTIATIIAGIVALSVVTNVLVAAMTAFNLVMALNPIGLIVLAVVALVAAFTALVVWIDEVSAGFDKLPGIVRVLLTPLNLVIKAIKFIKDNIGTITEAVDKVSAFGGMVGGEIVSSRIGQQVSSFFGFGEEEQRPAPVAQMISPQERTARSIEERRETSTAEVTIRDETNRAEVTSGKLGSGLNLLKTGMM